MGEDIKREIRKLRREAGIAYIASVNAEGYPQIKAMLVPEHESLRIHYFSTNLGSKRAGQFRADPRASVYYCDEAARKGALFTGKIEVCTDRETKALLWRVGFECYYPGGIDDEDYCVFRFTAETVNYYHGLSNATLPIEDL